MIREKVIIAALAAGVGAFRRAQYGLVYAALLAGAYAFLAMSFYDWIDE